MKKKQGNINNLHRPRPVQDGAFPSQSELMYIKEPELCGKAGAQQQTSGKSTFFLLLHSLLWHNQRKRSQTNQIDIIGH
jgi:hypothetical protein